MIPTHLDSRRAWRWMAVLVVLTSSAGCVPLRYQRPGRPIEVREGEVLVFGRLRFFRDGRELFPWNADLASSLLATEGERHLWLLRLDKRASSVEVHPDPDGSLAIWLVSGDYALVGTTEIPTSGPAPQELVALFRVRAGAVAAYAGDLIMTTERRDGLHASTGEFGEKSVILAPLDSARATFELKYGVLPGAPVPSPWCAGDHLPGFDDADLAARARELLDHACGQIE